MEVPQYATAPLRGFLDHRKEVSRLLHLAMYGIEFLIGIPDAMEVVQDNDKDLIEEAQARAELAKREVERGFPLLHAHTVVSLWGALEAAIEDTAVGIMFNEPHHLKNEALARIKVPLTQFETLDKEERIRYLIAELERGAAGAKRGIDCFETVLRCVGLDGSADDETKKSLWEMHHVRNVLVHRGGIADRRLTESCPWLSLEPGKLVVIAHDKLGDYYNGTIVYASEVLIRICEKYGLDMTDVRQKQHSCPIHGKTHKCSHS